MWIYDVIKKDFDDLSDDFLLKKFMERHKIVMKDLITYYGLDVQKIFLLQDFCLKWVFVLQFFTSMIVHTVLTEFLSSLT